MSTNEMLKDINGTILQKGQFVSYSPTQNNGRISFGVVYDNTHIINSDGKKLIPYKLVCLDENGVYNKQYNKTVAAVNAFDANLQRIKSMERIKAKDFRWWVAKALPGCAPLVCRWMWDWARPRHWR